MPQPNPAPTAADRPSALSTAVLGLLALCTALLAPSFAWAGEADLVLPKFSTGSYILLIGGMVVCAAGIAWGFTIYKRLENMPVHSSMLEISELIFKTCSTYLQTQGKFIALLWVFIAAVMVYYFGFLAEHTVGDKKVPFSAFEVALILFFSLVGIAGSYGVAWFGIRVNTFANSRAAFATLKGKPFPAYDIPLQAGISIGTVLICVELLLMLIVLVFLPGNLAGSCFIGFAIGESLGASALRIAGGIFTKIADIGSDLMKIVFKIREDDPRNPGVIADCTGDNAGDSVGPTADGFETYGVTGVALISFILLAVVPTIEGAQLALLVWIFMLRVLMVVTSIGAYFINDRMARAQYENADKMDFEKPLTMLVFITSGVSIVLTYVMTYFFIGSLGGDPWMWFKLSTIVSCGTIAGALIPELVKVFTSMHSAHVREVLTSSRQGGASLNILSGLTAGNFSCFWLGGTIALLMAIGYYVASMGVGVLLIGPQAVAVFAFGLIAFGFLGMGPVTIAVDSYGPVTDNAQSVFELSTIESRPNIKEELKRDFGFEPEFEKAKHFLEENDGAGNTFKATAKPVLIGTAVVGATTLIFSIIVMLTDSFKDQAAIASLSILNAPFLLGLILGGAIIYWFTGASTQAVVVGAYKAVEFIKDNIKLHTDGPAKANEEDSKKVVEICTRYAQNGMFIIFLTVFFATLAFAFADNALFIGYLVSIAIFGLYQAIFMANAGGAWDNAKKLVEVELKEKGTPLHDATVVGDTVGDPFKDTSSVAMNPVIKFTTLFGLLALEVAVEMDKHAGGKSTGRWWMFLICIAVTLVCVWASFYRMRIVESKFK